MSPTPDFVGNLLAWLASVIAWVGGEAGRQWLAGGAGGLVRWALAGRTVPFWQWIRTGMVQIAGGAITAHYGWPITLRIIETFTGDLGPPGIDPQSVATASFVAGMLGISAAKVLMAVFDRRATSVIEQKMGGTDGNA